MKSAKSNTLARNHTSAVCANQHTYIFYQHTATKPHHFNLSEWVVNLLLQLWGVAKRGVVLAYDMLKIHKKKSLQNCRL